jgi:dienelactone hydrolase
MTRIYIAVAVAVLFSASGTAAEVQTREIEYKEGETVLQGLMAWDDASKARRPGVLVVHEWWGHNEHARHQAKRLAEAGYIGFALDMYGKGKRFHAALELIKQDPHVSADRIAAIGYCFGGAVVLDETRAGTDLDAVVSFHGALATKSPAEPGKVQARVLVLTGAADPFVPKEQVEAFSQEMKAARAMFRVVTYPGVKHGFTNPDAGKAGMDALEYNAEADKKSWAAMLELLKEVFH